MRLINIFVLGAFLFSSAAYGQSEGPENIVSWQKGYLDIHHISTGQGDAAFMILPDGTSLLFDAGDLDTAAFNRKFAPLIATATFPSDSLQAGGWIAHYIKQVHPAGEKAIIDYALISHFHGDHYGTITGDEDASKKGDYLLSGITEVHEYTPIQTLIDRAAPAYDYPLPLELYYAQNKTFKNYLQFVRDQHGKGVIDLQSLAAGQADQIVLKNDRDQYDNFEVRGVKVNAALWTGEHDLVSELFPKETGISNQGTFSENPLSLGIKVSYGDFDYFTGGDITGMQGFGLPAWFDVESPVADVIEETDVITLNHHGNRDATNQYFIENVQPRVVVQQSWCSDHPGQEVLHRLNYYASPVDIFATNIHRETQVTLGLWIKENYKSMGGHVLIRVAPGGASYQVIILDHLKAELAVAQQFGPYTSN